MGKACDGESNAETYPGRIAKGSVSSTGHQVRDEETT
jgi:hypothetical protein